MDNMQTIVERDRDLAKDYFDASADGDTNMLASIFTEDIIWHQSGSNSLSGTYRGTDEVFGLFKQFMDRGEGSFRIDEVNDIMENGDLIAAVVHSSAKQPGGNISVSGVGVMRVDNGRIAEMWLFSSDQEAEGRFWNK